MSVKSVQFTVAAHIMAALGFYHGSADSHSGISNGGSAHIVEADCGSIWRKNFLPENRISSSLRPPLPSVSSIQPSVSPISSTRAPFSTLFS